MPCVNFLYNYEYESVLIYGIILVIKMADVYHVRLQRELSSAVLSEVEAAKHLEGSLGDGRHNAGGGDVLRRPVSHGEHPHRQVHTLQAHLRGEGEGEQVSEGEREREEGEGGGRGSGRGRGKEGEE